MAVQGAPFPFDLDYLLGGKYRAVVADLSAASPPAIPANIDDVMGLVSPYALKTGYEDLGAGREGASYSRGLGQEGWEIQQANEAVLPEVTGTARSITVSLAEIKPRTVDIVEESPGTQAIAAATNKSAQTRVPLGEILDLTYYRVALIGQRKVKSGTVIEPPGAVGGKRRGKFVMVVLNSCTISSDDSGFDLEKGNLSHMPVTFTAFPDAAAASGEEYGATYFELAGTIT